MIVFIIYFDRIIWVEFVIMLFLEIVVVFVFVVKFLNLVFIFVWNVIVYINLVDEF